MKHVEGCSLILDLCNKIIDSKKCFVFITKVTKRSPTETSYRLEISGFSKYRYYTM